METTRRLLLDAAAGAAAGAAATVPMSLLMWQAQRAGWMGEQPPRKITDGALDAADDTLDDVEIDPPEPARKGLTALNHLAFGAVAGVPFALVHRLFPVSLARVPAGAAYGVGVWASAYLGWVPALGFMPPADRDRPGRPASMVTAHLVYGSALGAALRVLRPVRA